MFERGHKGCRNTRLRSTRLENIRLKKVIRDADKHFGERHVWETYIWQAHVQETHVWATHIWETHVWVRFERSSCSFLERLEIARLQRARILPPRTRKTQGRGIEKKRPTHVISCRMRKTLHSMNASRQKEWRSWSKVNGPSYQNNKCKGTPFQEGKDFLLPESLSHTPSNGYGTQTRVSQD